MRYSTLRFVSVLLICSLVEQTYAAPLRSPLHRAATPATAELNSRTEEELEKDHANDAKLRQEAVSVLREQSVSFEPNVGQFPEDVRFAAQGVTSGVYLASNALALSVPLPSEASTQPPRPGEPLEPAARGYHSIRMEVVGARADAPAEEIKPTGRTTSYYRSDEKFEAIEHVAQVRFNEVYPATDLVYHGQSGRLEYDFVLEPGADPSALFGRRVGMDR